MRAEIGTLDPSEVHVAALLLSKSFAADPIITHYLHDPVRREVALPAFFEAVLEEMLPSATVYEARSGGRLVGVAAWAPPRPARVDEAARARADRCRRVVETMFPSTSAQLYAGFAALEEFHPPEPHWYLAFIGISPDSQGRGIGQELLAPLLHTADDTSASCYLETPFPRTHSFYVRLGFIRQADHDVFVGAPTGVATFLRQPKTDQR